ncbi:MAG: YbaB/EbfC family nucleoid-associated protein [Actinomycetota bacterium]
MQKMMREAQKMAAQVQEAQAALAEVQFEGSAGGGAVRAVVTGDQRVTSVTIDPDMFEGVPDQDDVEMLGDAVTAAVNDALTKAREAQEEAMGPIAGMGGGLGLPGM